MNDTSIAISHQDGLELLRSLESGSVDLILTDPPYVTSRPSGMHNWHEKGQSDSHEAKTHEEWENLKTLHEWKQFLRKGSVAKTKRKKKLQECKENFLKTGSIYGDKYGVQTDYGDWDSQFTLDKLNEFIKEFHRVLRNGGTCIVFFDIWKITNLKDMLEKSKFKQLRFIEWIKTNPVPINSKVNYLTNSREIALSAIKKSKPTFNSQYDSGIYSYPIQGGKNRTHPTQKNLELFKTLIKKHSNEGDLVLDCFLGSGTTAVACNQTKRSFVGCERDEEYYNNSIAWLNRDTKGAQTK